MVDQSLARIVPPEQPDELPGILARLRRGERIEHYETVRVHRDGHRLDVSISISPIRNEHGALIAAATIARDVTERKQAEAERQRLELERARLYAEVQASEARLRLA